MIEIKTCPLDDSIIIIEKILFFIQKSGKYASGHVIGHLLPMAH